MVPISLYMVNGLSPRDFGLQRPFIWIFPVVAVQTSIIGSDFLSYFNLLVDFKKRRLIDTVTDLNAKL